MSMVNDDRFQQQIDNFLQYIAAERGFSANTAGAYRNDLTQFAGFLHDDGRDGWQLDRDILQRYRSGVADSVTVFSTPTDSEVYLNADLGVYAQDSWTVASHLTVQFCSWILAISGCAKLDLTEIFPRLPGAVRN